PGQPVIVPGDMGRYSYLLVGTEAAMRETFGSTCHGAGRVLSRSAAVRAARGRRVDLELRERGVVARATGKDALAEEMPEAYKDVKDVVDVVHRFGISLRVARLWPLGVFKGCVARERQGARHARGRLGRCYGDSRRNSRASCTRIRPPLPATRGGRS